MKRTLKIIESGIMLALSFYFQTCLAGPGALFSISQSGATLSSPANIILCLNGNGPLSCQTYTVTKATLAINTTITNHTYQNAGIKAPSGFSISSGCTEISNGYCLFSVSKTSSATINLSNSNFIAVGSYNTGTTDPVTYYSPDYGISWTRSIPSSIAGSTDTALQGVGCDSTGESCVAVGYSSASGYIPLAYYTTTGGVSWTQSSPTKAGSSDNFLNGVSCGSDGQNCITVGQNDIDALAFYTTNGGQSWTTSLPARKGSSDNQLLSIACASDGQYCVAVGRYSNGGPHLPLSYYTTNGGQTWTEASPTAPVGTVRSYLNGIACDSTAQNCTAVGYYATTGNDAPLSYYTTDGGKTWNTVLPTTQSSFSNHLNAVSCDSTGQICTTVGIYDNGAATIPLGYYSINGGQSWISSNPPTQGHSDEELNGVTCDSSGLNCAAVGFYFNGVITPPLVYYSQNGGQTWVVTSLTYSGSTTILYGAG